MERIERTPGRRVTLPDIEEGIGQFWGADVCEVHRADAPETVSALLFDAISITLSTNSQHGQLNGGIRLDGGYLTACFGTWLMADHPDKTRLFRVCEFIGKWSRLRLDLPERHQNPAQDGESLMGEGGELAPSLSPEEQQRSIDRIRELIRRKEDGEFNLRPGVPEKAESMLPGIRTISPASGPGVRYRLEANDEEADRDV